MKKQPILQIGQVIETPDGNRLAVADFHGTIVGDDGKTYSLHDLKGFYYEEQDIIEINEKAEELKKLLDKNKDKVPKLFSEKDKEEITQAVLESMKDE